MGNNILVDVVDVVDGIIVGLFDLIRTNGNVIANIITIIIVIIIIIFFLVNENFIV